MHVNSERNTERPRRHCLQLCWSRWLVLDLRLRRSPGFGRDGGWRNHVFRCRRLVPAEVFHGYAVTAIDRSASDGCSSTSIPQITHQFVIPPIS